ncbi:uncharacterized protein (TIGR02569 family) [Curtobacterium flaccumfaciens]|uniref:Uncharacterized protein (TIGR02569 family) n=1 Tax=Curtobacterium flaccumfaciens TaxID=2035 RepID=A0A4R6DFT7_9MICO|nr:hypothetical protein [Curtobacterium flaccumfaciens]TDN43481.1 uncharacterized protein (TIGR02569 family) [Curtobacterium flaccumfaciens]
MNDAAAAAPSAGALAAFGVGESVPVPLAGGRGLTWRAGDVVLRPHDGAAETDWRSGVLATLEHTAGFRTPRPIATADGHWRAGRWEAWEWLPAVADETRVEDVIRAGAAFHRAIAHLDRPAFLDGADDAWSRADRMAWGELPLQRPLSLPSDPSTALLSDPSRARSLDRLAAAFRPVRAPAQLVHRDLLGNVLFADGQPPAVIDWSPTWRPAGFGAAIAAVDAVCWHGVPPSRLGPLGDGIAEWGQLLVRALAFRIATLHLLGAWDADGEARHRPVVDALV